MGLYPYCPYFLIDLGKGPYRSSPRNVVEYFFVQFKSVKEPYLLRGVNKIFLQFLRIWTKFGAEDDQNN
jgi:hypothetical protein